MFSPGLQGLLMLPTVKYGAPTQVPPVVPLYGVPVSQVPPTPTPNGALFTSTETLLALAAAIILIVLGSYVLLRMLFGNRK